MTSFDLSLAELTARAYARATPAKKWARLVDKWFDERQTTSEERQDELAAALLQNLLPTPSALLLNYLSEAILSDMLTSRTMLLHLLFHLQTSVPPLTTILSLASILSARPSGLDASTPLPSSLAQPTISSQAGPSSPSAKSTWTLDLLIPLLRFCTTPTPPVQLVSLLAGVLSIVAPYPAPPFDVGLEASQLMAALPEVLSTPLRDALSGLMTDLAISESTAQLQVNGDTNVKVNTATSGLPSNSDLDMQPVGQLGNMRVDGSDLSIHLASRPSGLALQHALALLLSASKSRRTGDRSLYDVDPPAARPELIDALRICMSMCETPDDTVRLLLQIAMEQTVSLGELTGINLDAVLARHFWAEDIPVLMRWWKDHSDVKYPFLVDLSAIVRTTFDGPKTALESSEEWLRTTFERSAAQLEEDDHGGSFITPEGWSIASLREAVVRRMADLGVLDKSACSLVLPNISIEAPFVPTGESLLHRLATAPKPHLNPLTLIVCFSPGAARSLAAELIPIIKACPATPPPENLFTNLSSCPPILASLSAYIAPATLQEIMVQQLIEHSEEASVRSDDPQGSMTRFGEGVVLVETFSALHDLPLPDLLLDSRIALSWRDLTDEEKRLMNGWVKALFGSEGIDDEILLSTSPQDFCRLSCGLIQQAIQATAAGQIDQDTLHSGLSYFCQPLLSWSLGGIVSWLCEEIKRQGLISALHLDVLQNLVLGSAIPEGVLKTRGASLTELLSPRMGLEAVFQSSRFDVEGVKAKFVAAGISLESPVTVTFDALVTLRSDLQLLRQVGMAPPNWAAHVVSSITRSIKSEGAGPTVDVLMGEVLAPSMPDQSQEWNDSLPQLLTYPLVTRIGNSETPLLVPLIIDYLPELLDRRVDQYLPRNISAFALLIRSSLLVLLEIDASLANHLATALVDEMTYQLARSVDDAGSKKPRTIRGARGISTGSRAIVERLKVVMGDEEVKGKLEACKRLEG